MQKAYICLTVAYFIIVIFEACTLRIKNAKIPLALQYNNKKAILKVRRS